MCLGEYQNSSVIQRLRNEVEENRKLQWKWGITLTDATSEVVSYLF